MWVGGWVGGWVRVRDGCVGSVVLRMCYVVCVCVCVSLRAYDGVGVRAHDVCMMDVRGKRGQCCPAKE